MNFRKPRDTGLAKRVVRFQMLNDKSHLTAAEKYCVVRNRYINQRAYEDMKERVKKFNFY